MVVATTINMDLRELNKMQEVPKVLIKALETIPQELADYHVVSMRRQFVLGQTKAPRGKTANKFRAKHLSKRRSVITIPVTANYLDKMRPHYVSLKPGRNITTWAQRYYDGTPRRTGRSRVSRGPRGGVKGSIFVTPHPFIDAAEAKTMTWFSRHLRNKLLKVKEQLGG